MQAHEVLQKVENHLSEKLAQGPLSPVGLSQDIALAQGNIQSEPVSMKTRRWQSERFESVTLASIVNSQNHLLSVTLSALPAPQFPFPIWGMDYVGFRGSLSLLAMDLYPVEPSFFEEVFSDFVISQRTQSTEALISRKSPDLPMGALSPLAMVAAAKTEEQMRLAQSLALEECDFYFQKSLNAQQDMTLKENKERIRQWKQSMLKNKKELGALSRIFGAEYAQHYLHEFLFA